jgi:hypothetical protein
VLDAKLDHVRAHLGWAALVEEACEAASWNRASVAARRYQLGCAGVGARDARQEDEALFRRAEALVAGVRDVLASGTEPALAQPTALADLVSDPE